jgi:NADPH:quinone reductase-like Zn-dependent oxidoreductase
VNRRLRLLPIAVAALIAAGSTLAAIPDTMLAAAIDHGGGPEVLSIHRLPVPKPAPGEVLIKVHAAGVGVWEQHSRQSPDEDTHFPLILGSDGAGIVAAVGAGVHHLKVGDKVYGTSEAFYAEYVTARADHVAPVPKGVGLTEAGVLAISGLSALQGIDDVLQLKAGDTVLIHGAAGAVGALAIQFAKLRGAKVLATASDDSGLALVKRLGADAAVNGRTGNITAAARQWAPDGVDAVFALAGGDSLERCIDALRTDGRGRIAYLYGMQPLPQPRFATRMTLYTFIAGFPEFERLNKAVEAARLQVPIGAEYPLAAAADAHRRLEAGHLLGKIVLRVQ